MQCRGSFFNPSGSSTAVLVDFVCSRTAWIRDLLLHLPGCVGHFLASSHGCVCRLLFNDNALRGHTLLRVAGCWRYKVQLRERRSCRTAAKLQFAPRTVLRLIARPVRSVFKIEHFERKYEGKFVQRWTSEIVQRLFVRSSAKGKGIDQEHPENRGGNL